MMQESVNLANLGLLEFRLVRVLGAGHTRCITCGVQHKVILSINIEDLMQVKAIQTFVHWVKSKLIGLIYSAKMSNRKK